MRVDAIQQRSWERCCDRGEKGTTVWLDTIHSECRREVSAKAITGKTACGEERSARTLKADDSAIGVTTDRSRRVREFDFCWLERAGHVAMTAASAERPSSGAKLTRMIRPNRTEVLLLPILARAPIGNRLAGCKPAPQYGHHGGRLGQRVCGRNYDLHRFPAIGFRYRSTPAGGFIARLSPDGGQLLASTYIAAQPRRLALDSTGKLYVAGGTKDASFATTPGAFQTTLQGNGDAFVLKIDPLLRVPVYSTLLGGMGYSATAYACAWTRWEAHT